MAWLALGVRALGRRPSCLVKYGLVVSTGKTTVLLAASRQGSPFATTAAEAEKTPKSNPVAALPKQKASTKSTEASSTRPSKQPKEVTVEVRPPAAAPENGGGGAVPNKTASKNKINTHGDAARKGENTARAAGTSASVGSVQTAGAATPQRTALSISSAAAPVTPPKKKNKKKGNHSKAAKPVPDSAKGSTQAAKSTTAAQPPAVVPKNTAKSRAVSAQGRKPMTPSAVVRSWQHKPPPGTRGAKPLDSSNPEFKRASRKYISVMVALPILLVTSYVLFDRLVLGNPVKDLGPLLGKSHEAKPSES